MGTPHGAICDDFFFSSRLTLKMDLDASRETVLQFFERIRKDVPTLGHLRRRGASAFALEESDDAEARRNVRLSKSGIRLSYANPPSLAAARQFGALILENAPFFLTLSDLDYDYLEVVHCFDLQYSGNHDELVAETFLADHPLAAILLGSRTRHVIDCQPFFGIALNDSCDTQAYIEFKGRSSTYEIRTGRYESQPLSVLLTMRKYWGDNASSAPAEVFAELCDHADELSAEQIIPLVVNPLAQAIAGQP